VDPLRLMPPYWSGIRPCPLVLVMSRKIEQKYNNIMNYLTKNSQRKVFASKGVIAYHVQSFIRISISGF
jgi:hypothetical protein